MQKLGLIKENSKTIFPLLTTRPRTMTFADYQLLTPEQKQGEIVVTDYPAPEESDKVEVVADGDKTLSTLLNELFALTDFSKISEHSYVLSGANNKNLFYIAQYNSTNQTATFVWNAIYANTKFIQQTYNLSSNSSAEQIFGTDYSSFSGSKLSNGIKITLYYNSTKTLELGTLAENCMMSDGSSVEDAVDSIENGWVDITSEITWHSAVAYKKAIFNPALKLIKVQVTSDDTGIGNSSAFLTLPNKYTPKTDLMMKIGNNYYTQSDVFYAFTTSIASTSVIWHNGRFLIKSSSPRALVLNYNVAQTAYYHQGWAEFYVDVTE